MKILRTDKYDFFNSYYLVWFTDFIKILPLLYTTWKCSHIYFQDNNKAIIIYNLYINEQLSANNIHL